jgi:hypothetical protein
MELAVDKMIKFIVGNNEPVTWLSCALRRWNPGMAQSTCTMKNP